MSTSKKKLVDNHFAKWLVIANGFVPLLLLVIDAKNGNLGVNEVNFAIKTTGLVGLILLILSLLITPLRRFVTWPQLLAIRRNLGVLGFTYILCHFLIFFWWDRGHSVSSTLDEIIEREYLWYGFGALVLMTPLAITSTDRMVGLLGGKRWKLLHRLTYLAIPAGGWHYYLQAKSDKRQPTAFLVAIAVLLVARIALRFLPKKKRKRTFWSGMLKVASITPETHDVKTFRFVNPDGGQLPFQHIAGQYISLKLTIDGKRVNRSYTIASPPTRRDYVEISVKRASYGSVHLHDTFSVGQLVSVSAPAGKFYFAGTEAKRVVLIAGGIGITPMMSVIRAMTDRKWAGEMFLVFSVRKKIDIVFEKELADLAARFPNVHVLVTLTNDPDAEWSGARGQIDAEKLRGFIPNFTRGPVMLCGPDKMMTAMRELLVGMGIPNEDVQQEEFISTPAVDPAAPPVEMAEELPDGIIPNLAFKKSGINAEQPPELSVLEVAEDAGVEIPNECRSGVCGQCKVRLISGKVKMETQDALSHGDRAKGLVLACQAHATSRDCVFDV
ncbi:MAG: 2Fe-2S iron-sulfur cluster-binding protein [Kofleriaceae bacterium]